MISHTTERFRKAFKVLPGRVRRQAREAYRLFEQNPYHPSLHFKPIHPTRPIYSVRISCAHSYATHPATSRMFAPILKRTFPLEPELVLISAGPFLMGSTDDDHLAGDDEKPQHTVELLDYYIGRYPVTNVQYQVFVREAGQQAPWGWNGVSYPEEEGDYPVTYVSWYDAVVYCQWLSQNTGRP